MKKSNKKKLFDLGFVLFQDTDDDLQLVYKDDMIVFEGDDENITNFINMLLTVNKLEKTGYKIELSISSRSYEYWCS